MKILTIDTSSSSCSASLTDSGRLLAEVVLHLDKTVSSRLLETIDQLFTTSALSIHELDGIAVACGPGSFTGLRVGIATAQGLALATGKPVVGVSSLAMLAMNCACLPYPVCPMFDARKKEVYTGLYRVDPVCVQLIPDCVTEPHRFVATITEPTVFIGDGAAFYRALIEQELGNLALFPPLAFNHSRASSGALLAAEMFARGEGGGVTGLKATYLRRSEAELAKIRKEI